MMDDTQSDLSIIEAFLNFTPDMAPFPTPPVAAEGELVPLADALGETLATLADVDRSPYIQNLDDATNFQNDELQSGYMGYMNDFENVSEPSGSPAPSMASSTGGGSFSFPPQAPTPEAALMLEDCLAHCPSMDTTSLFFKHEAIPDNIQHQETKDETPATATNQALAAHIKKRRRASGLVEIPSDDETESVDVDKNQLTRSDIIRRERRRASNRRAATKCRMKKKAQEEESKTVLTELQNENAALKAEVTKLRSSRSELQTKFERHLALCRHVHPNIHR